MSRFYIDPNIARAKTIAKDFYIDSKYFELAKEKIFANSWQYVGHKDQVKEPGDVQPVNLLENYLDEPLVITRDKENIVHCLSNVCNHRGNLLAYEACKSNQLRCKYHGRLFHLNGRFISMPEFGEVENFIPENNHLKQLPLFEWGKLLFTSLNPIFPASDFFTEMLEIIGWLPLNKMEYRKDLSNEFLVNANWALYCENYLEGFHIPFVHPTLNAVIEFKNYTTETFKYSNLQVGIAKEGVLSFELPENSKYYGKQVAAFYFWVYPNMMFNFYPWGLSLNIIEPQTESTTKVRFLCFVYDASKLEQGAGSGLTTVEAEDEEVVENVQKGIRSRFYKHGRYAVHREQGTHHFHSLLAESLNA
ncbi:MAG: aromatic ring-hydroxylating dioxygenase subunit alpha [Bacteroidota bacterium]